MRRKALLKGPTLLHQKYRYGTEVHFYLEELLALLIGLDNHFDDKDFNELKLNNMVAVIVTNPSITTFMFNLLLTGDYSLQQRVLILSATLMAARRLRGFSPTNFRRRRYRNLYIENTLSWRAVPNTSILLKMKCRKNC